MELVKKIRTNIYIDKNILQEAQELGLNVSKTCENALKIAIERLKPLYSQNISKEHQINSVSNRVEPRAGFEPATSALPRQCPTS
jgi:post-segregation antitoxin (ccd killing protein)